MTLITIDVISDFICAWCFIGKRKLDQAISLYKKTYPGGKEDVFQIAWRPYFLNYSNSATSVDKLDLANTKLAHMSAEQRSALGLRMSRIGHSVGINFKWGGRVGRTENAHKLVYMSRSLSADTQNALVEALFQAYHENEKDISSRAVLLEIATRIGINEEQVTECLDNVDDEANVEAEAMQFQSQISGSGVPAFLIHGDHKLSGAQEIQDFMEIFIKVKECDS
ncbi:hypothetical protein QQS21_004673 [Conoideocrella luteorostrata]|uniref:DSBA-like thioredoxin domain-containing protein n=1 Tax=Conoideocrella luteorostrata TaxID=1105319 RepID=A0AAJ0CRY0_9HYPO|nr:hypothetical protein QQS21_004673 [Conoideocrella luteorostrata]